MEEVFCKGCGEHLYTAEMPRDYVVPFCVYCLDAIFEEHWICENLLELKRTLCKEKKDVYSNNDLYGNGSYIS